MNCVKGSVFGSLAYCVGLGMMAVPQLNADTLLSDFSTVNPLNPAFRTAGPWYTDGSGAFVPQIHNFQSGSILGQEISPVGTGAPNVRDDSGVDQLQLDLSGNGGLSLTARIVPGNEAANILVGLRDTRNVDYYWIFPTSNFNTATFNTATLLLSDGLYSYGPTGDPSQDQLDLSHISFFDIAGNYYDIGSDGVNGSALVGLQLSRLEAVTVPEPASVVMLGVGGLILGGFGLHGKRRG